ncbi:MAG: hypothetical protein NVSMB66_0350 [Candidatus Doudnabacteria bacterium]
MAHTKLELSVAEVDSMAKEIDQTNQKNSEVISQILDDAAKELKLLEADVQSAEHRVAGIEKETIEQVDSALVDFLK